MKRCLHCKAAIESKTWSGKQAITMKEKAKIQWNLCNPTPEFSAIQQKFMVSTYFL
jgi:hypothetical protein